MPPACMDTLQDLPRSSIAPMHPVDIINLLEIPSHRIIEMSFYADPADHHDAGRRVVPQLHGQRVWVRTLNPVLLFSGDCTEAAAAAPQMKLPLSESLVQTAKKQAPELCCAASCSHPEWIDFPRDDTYDTSTGAFVPGAHCNTMSAQSPAAAEPIPCILPAILAQQRLAEALDFDCPQAQIMNSTSCCRPRQWRQPGQVPAAVGPGGGPAAALQVHVRLRPRHEPPGQGASRVAQGSGRLQECHRGFGHFTSASYM